MIMSGSNGSAHRGLGEWLIQRLSALYLAGFLLWLAIRLGLQPFSGYSDWKDWMSGPAVRLAFAMFFLCLLLHAWVGMRSVFLDYLKPLWLRLIVQLATAITLLLLGFWAAQILLVEAVRA